jgi:hypothetical protein
VKKSTEKNIMMKMEIILMNLINLKPKD